jgi:fumarate reductase subunit D
MVDTLKDKEIQEGKFFALISYISFLCIVSLVLKKDNKFALYHAKQGLVLFVLEVAVFIISVIPFLGWLIGVLGVVIFTLFSIWGILQALMGNLNRLPLISDIADKVII